MVVLVSCLAGASSNGVSEPAPPAAPTSIYGRIYGSYRPDFVDKERLPGAEEMSLSSETSFYTLNLLPESERAYALVKAARQKEAEGAPNEAMEIYQKIIDEYPDELYRVSPYGVFVPVPLYCQLRMLGFPQASLRHYRTKHDARAAEAFSLARQNHSLEGLAHVRDAMLATSYGASALLALGDAALDRGHYLKALEYYGTVRARFPDDDVKTPELGLKEDYCCRMLGDTRHQRGAPEAPSALPAETLDALRRLVDTAHPRTNTLFVQRSSPPNVTADDYARMPATRDPLGLDPPVWKAKLPGSRLDFYVYFNPVVTDNSIVYRHKNIVYSRSILNGRLRWQNALGGRVTWQNWGARQYRHEDVLVQDGLVFTTVHQVGPTLVALDEITGQLQWAYGPMVAGTQSEANMRFEAAPACGPHTVFAGYVLDNIEGTTHTDTEYGVMAFESTTGRIRGQQHLCRLRPGLFAASWRPTERLSRSVTRRIGRLTWHGPRPGLKGRTGCTAA
jgi:tetratricopeptide (TPR) repeat protein